MPIYKYECDQCSHIFEDLRSFSDPDPEECPACGAAAPKKLISGGHFMLKGSGWYVTDYADKSSASKPPSEQSAGEEGAGSAQAQPAPAAKPEASDAV